MAARKGAYGQFAGSVDTSQAKCELGFSDNVMRMQGINIFVIVPYVWSTGRASVSGVYSLGFETRCFQCFIYLFFFSFKLMFTIRVTVVRNTSRYK